MTGKVSLLRPEFVRQLQRTAKQYDHHHKRAGRYQFILARRVNEEWAKEYEGEVRKEDYYAACSYEINAALGFPICSYSGETLRRWCELDSSYRNISESLYPLFDILSIEHFRIARRLAKLPENESKCNTPEHILAFAYANKMTADEMEQHFDPNKAEPVHPYDSAIGHFDSLLTNKFEWIRDVHDRQEIVRHLSEARKIAERYH